MEPSRSHDEKTKGSSVEYRVAYMYATRSGRRFCRRFTRFDRCRVGFDLSRSGPAGSDNVGRGSYVSDSEGRFRRCGVVLKAN